MVHVYGSLKALKIDMAESEKMYGKSANYTFFIISFAGGFVAISENPID